MINIRFLKNVFFIIIIFLFANSCTSPDMSAKKFDYPLLRDNEILRLAGSYRKCMLLNEEYLEKAKKSGYKDGEALCYINLSNICVTIGNYKKGFIFLKKAEVTLKNSENKALKARLYQEYGQLNKVTGLHKNALKCNSKALYYTKNCTQEEEKRYFLSRVYANRADFLYEINRIDSSLIYFHKALKVENTSLINSMIANHHMYYSGNLDSTKFYIDKSLKLIDKDTLISNAQDGIVYRVAGAYYGELGNYMESTDFYKKALNVFLKTHRVYNIPFIYESIAEAYKGMGDKQREKEYENKYLDAKVKLSQDQNETVNLLVDKILSENNDYVEGLKQRLFLIVFLFIIVLTAVFVLKYKNLNYKKSKLSEETVILKNQTELLTNETEVLAGKVNESFSDLIMLAKRNDSFFLARFQEVYPEFIEALLNINETLSGADLQLCAMIKLNFSSKEIATNMSILHKSAQQKKYRLRKKLNVSSDQDLYTFFQGLDA